MGFIAGNVLKRITLTGGAAVTLHELESLAHGASWGSDDSILFGRHNSSIWRIPAVGGTPTPVTTVEPEDVDHANPHLLPGGTAVMFRVQTVAGGPNYIAVRELGAGERKRLVDGSRSWPRVDREGQSTPIPVPPDDSRVAVSTIDTIWVFDLLRGARHRLIQSGRDSYFPCQWQPKTAHLWQPKTAHFWGGRLGRSGHSPGDARRACWAGRRERSDRSPGQHAPGSCGAGGHVATPSRCSSDAVLSPC